MSLKRVKRVQKALSDWGVDALLITDPIDLYYLTGIHVTVGTVVITKKEAALFVDNRYSERCEKESPIKVLAPSALTDYLAKAKSIGFSQDTLTYGAYLKLAGELPSKLVPLDSPMQKIRAIKEPKEVAAQEAAIQLCFRGFDFVKTRLYTGVSEEEVAKDLQLFWLANGGEALSFDSIIAFGKNSSMPHYRAGSDRLSPNDIVLVDIGVVVNGYASDMTRVFFYGKPHKKLEAIYNIVLEAQTKSIKAVKPGRTAAELYGVSKKIIDKAGYGKNYLHGLGHGIGLETHEQPYLRAANTSCHLEPGMCITIEPGIYLPNVGGVRIEDMVLVTKDGHRNLTAGYPKTVCSLKVRSR